MSDTISTAQPRYAQIKEAIRRRISSGDWPEGFQIPSEHKLLEEFSVSRMTVHRALRDLTDEGLLTRVQGHLRCRTAAQHRRGGVAQHRRRDRRAR